MKDTEVDAYASGSGPSESGSQTMVSGPAGKAESGALEQGRPRDGEAGVTARTQAADACGETDTPPQDGRLDHHKDKKGRKRRRRRRGGQKNGAAIQADAAPDGAASGADPAAPPAPKKRRRRRRKPVTAVMNMVANAASGVEDAVAAVVPAAAVQHEAARAQPQPQQQRHRDAYAALDLGTNNCRLLVATPTRPGQFRVVDAFSRIVRLGEGLSRTGRLSEEAMDRAIGALRICREKLEARPMRRMRLIATEACRSAENGEEFLARVKQEAGLKLDIVDRETEARLAVSGCSSLVDRDTNSVVLFDIGGGSSEIALVDVSTRRSRRLADHIVAWTSLKIGVVTLSEKFGGQHVSPETFAAMTDHATDLLMAFEDRNRLADRVGNDGFHLLGTSGTVTTLAGIHLDLPRYDRRRVDGLWMTSAEVDAMNARLLSWSFDERVANPCIGADRADLVLAGCAILEAIRRIWPSKRLRVADRGLREGLLTEMMASDGAWRRSAHPYRSRPGAYNGAGR